MPKSLSLVLLIAGIVGLFFSMREIVWESRIAAVFVPTPAEVLSSNTSGLAQGKASTYFPTVRYRYSVGGTNYESTRIWPYTGTIYRPEAMMVMQKFPAKAIVTAYVDPRDPASSVLIRDYSSFPYWPAAAALVVMALGCGNLVQLLSPGRKTMQTKIANDFGWRLLVPAKRFTERMLEAVYLLAAIGLPMLALAYHLACHFTSKSAFTVAFVATALLVFLALLIWAGRVWRFTRRVSDLRLMVNTAPMRLDAPFIMRLEADIRSRIQFSEMRARVVCIRRNLLHNGRRTHLQSVVLGERILKLAGKSALPKGDVLKGTSETVFKADNWPPSGREAGTTYPYILWELRIEVIGPTRFKVTFPLEVVTSDLARSGAQSVWQKV